MITRRFLLGASLALTGASLAPAPPAGARARLQPDLRHAFALKLSEARIWSGNGAPQHPLIIDGERFEEAPFADFLCEHDRTNHSPRVPPVRWPFLASGYVTLAHCPHSAFLALHDAMRNDDPMRVWSVLFDANAGGKIEGCALIMVGRVCSVELRHGALTGSQATAHFRGVAP